MESSSGPSRIISERIGNFQLITMNAPERLNAIDSAMMEDMKAAIADAESDPEVGALVVTGAGRGFCAGATLSEGDGLIGSRDRIGSSLRAVVNPLVMMIYDSPLPVVAAVNGPAAGAGFGIAMAADVILASLSASFTRSFVRIGASLDAGTSVVVKNAVGTVRAKAMALLGEKIDAQTAKEWGLVWAIHEPDELMNATHQVAEQLAAGPRAALASVKRLMNQVGGDRAGLTHALSEEASAQSAAFRTADFVEGVEAFQQKRPPVFGKGR